MADIKVNDIVKFSVDNIQYCGIVKNVSSDEITVYNYYNYEKCTLTKDEVTIIEPVRLDKETYKKLARYEITLQDILGDNVVENILNKDGYLVTLEDVLSALQKFVCNEIHPDIFFDEWFCYFNTVLDQIEYNNTDNSFYNRNTVLQNARESMFDGFHFDYETNCEEIVFEIQCFLEDEHKNLLQRRYPEYAKINLLLQLDEGSALNVASDEEAELYKIFAEELCAKDNKYGLLAVGYGCYGGNRVFPCDWKRSEDCMLKLIDIVNSMPDRAFYANTLGYIYYYGRTTDGVPDYEKAYKYFSFAAFNGVFEAEYKIADMFKNGYGVPQSSDTAFRIIKRLYDENIKYIQKGQFDCKFADIAFRMGNECKDEKNPDGMLHYYYQARYAIRMRMKERNIYGDSNVAKAIEKALDDVKYMINFQCLSKINLLNIMPIFYDHLTCGNWLDVDIRKLSNGNYKLIFKAHKPTNESYRKRLFITIPKLDMCGLYDSLTVIAKPLKDDNILSLDNSFIINKIEHNAFFFDGDPVISFRNCTFEIKQQKNNNKKYRFVSVVFSQGGKSYDYLCDNNNIKIGDKIMVTANDEQKEVTVVGIFEKTESETALPIKCYKRVQ